MPTPPDLIVQISQNHLHLVLMEQLRSRAFPSSTLFVDDYLKTLTPGVIPNNEFINWVAIDKKLIRMQPMVEFYISIREAAHSCESFIREMGDSLLSSDDPYDLIKGGFELLGHTDTEIATKQAYFDFKQASEMIKNHDQNVSYNVAGTLYDLGISKVLLRDDLEDILMGIQIGLETHRRKNVCGTSFSKDVKKLLLRVVDEVGGALEDKIEIKEEENIRFENGLSKRVDFAILVNGKVKYGIEVNFYTSSGSKPTEIKRSYGDIQTRMNSKGISLIWITDGKGYFRMQRSLKDAYEIVPNIYNYRGAETHLSADIIFDLQSE